MNKSIFTKGKTKFYRIQLSHMLNCYIQGIFPFLATSQIILSSLVCWSQLTLACKSQLYTFNPSLPSVTSSWQPDTEYEGSIYTIKIGNKSGLFFVGSQLLNMYHQHITDQPLQRPHFHFYSYKHKGSIPRQIPTDLSKIAFESFPCGNYGPQLSSDQSVSLFNHMF